MNKRYAAAAKFAAAALFSILAVVLAASIFVMIVSANERYRVAGDFAQFLYWLYTLRGAATAAGVLGIRAVGQASAEGPLEMLGKCRGERKTQEFLLQEMERLGYKGGSVRIGHCGNAAFSLELYTELRRRFPDADVRRYPLRGLCSYYAERGGIMMGFET